MTPPVVTITIDRATADDLLQRLLTSALHEGDSHECYMIVLLADALGEPVSQFIRNRARVFA